MSNLTTLNFENREVRMTRDGDQPWWLATDVCAALGFANPWDATAKHVDSDDLAKREVIDSMGRKQSATFINESGLYALIFGSRLESAKRFKRWVTSEVLPAIRKTGAYQAPAAPSQLVTLKEAARRSGFTPGALRSRRWRGDLPFPLFKVAGEWRADAAQVEAWIRRVKMTTGPGELALPGRVIHHRLSPSAKVITVNNPRLPVRKEKPMEPKKLQDTIESTLIRSLSILMSERCRSGEALSSRDCVDVYDMLKSCAANLGQVLAEQMREATK